MASVAVHVHCTKEVPDHGPLELLLKLLPGQDRGAVCDHLLKDPRGVSDEMRLPFSLGDRLEVSVILRRFDGVVDKDSSDDVQESQGHESLV